MGSIRSSRVLIAARRRGSDAAPYVLAVGGVSPRKNTRRLIEAFSRWRARGGHRAPYRLLITGTSLDHDFAAVQRSAGGVSLLGYVDKAELPGLYAGAAAFLYPGIYEGFGLPIIEAMACGSPGRHLATPGPRRRSPATQRSSWIRSTSPAWKRDSSGRRTPDEAERLRVLGHERARAFRWEAAAQATIDVYRRVLA